jgi:hypothetical protein
LGGLILFWENFNHRRNRFTQRSQRRVADFGLRREVKRHAAFGMSPALESGVAAALCHRTPNLCPQF